MKTFKLLDVFLLDGYYVTQNYGANKSYYSQFNLIHGHEGVDFGNSNKKISVRSPLSGTAFVGYDVNYGNYTVVEDYKQGCAIYACHLDSVKVASGQEVKAGDAIGEMGDTGNSDGEHVHLNFLILNSSGSNKYRQKQWNWGFLDPRYPRDTGDPISFAGVETYSIEWVIELEYPAENGDSMANYYKGYDLDNKDSMKVAVDTLVRVQGGEFIDKKNYEESIKQINEQCDQRVNDARTTERKATINSIRLELGLPDKATTFTTLVAAIKALVSVPSGNTNMFNPDEWDENGGEWTEVTTVDGKTISKTINYSKRRTK